MRVIVGLFSLLPLLTWLLTHKKYKDIAAPYNLFTFLYIINVMIPILSYVNVSAVNEISESYIRNAVLNNITFSKYVILQTLSYYFVIFGTKLRLINRKKSYDSKRISNSSYGKKKYLYMGILFWIIGTIAFFGIMRKVGGIYYFFTHLQYRASLTRNIDFLSWILPFVNYGVLLIIYSYKGSDNPLNIKIIFLIIVSGIMSGLGGRKALIILFMEAILLYHYTIKEIDIKNFIKIKYILGIVVLYLFFILMSKFRTEGAVETFLNNPIFFILDSNKGLIDTIQSESYVRYFMALIEYFKSHSLWLGRSFLGLITSIIPSSLFPGKPPVDDGTYLYSICKGRTDIVPPMPFNQLNGSSLPLETFGSMYANFGVIGLFMGMTILGIIYGYFYRKMKRSSYSLFSVVIYTQIIFTFQLSTLRMFQLFELIVVFAVVTFISSDRISFRGRRR